MNPDPTSETNPTLDNVLPEWKPPSLLVATKPDPYAADEGALVAIPGGLPCPWCGATCVEIDQTMIAVCQRNPLHKVEWMVWGG